MKNALLTGFIFLFGINFVKGQDRILFNDSTQVKCFVDEISDDSVKYRRLSNPRGPYYIISRDKVVRILLEDELKECVPHKVMIRYGISAYNPIVRDFVNQGKSGSSFSNTYQFVFFVDRGKTLSIATNVYSFLAETRNIPLLGINVDLIGLGVATKMDCHWKRWSTGSLYSGLGLGYLKLDYFYTSDGSSNNPQVSEFSERESGIGFQIDVIGVQYAPFRRLGLFGELGVGYEGAFQAGIQIHW